jgi:hypothetical protein
LLCRYPHGNQEWFTADEISELTSEEEEAMTRQLKNPRDSSSFVEEEELKAEKEEEKAENKEFKAMMAKYKERREREEREARESGQSAAKTTPSLFKSEAEIEREMAFKPVLRKYYARKEERRLSRESRDERKKARLRELAAEEKKEWRPPTRRPDTTGIFDESVTWKSKIRMLRLAKKEAWSGTTSPFTLRLLGVNPAPSFRVSFCLSCTAVPYTLLVMHYCALHTIRQTSISIVLVYRYRE